MISMGSKKTIIFVNQSSGYLMIDIINQHIDKYDKVILLTGFLNPRNQPLNKKVKVHFLKSYDKNSFIKRLFSWTIFFLQSWYFIFLKYRTAVVYFVSNPPLTVFLARFLKRNYVFLVYDVYPDAFVQYNLLSENNFIVRRWKMINQQVFQKSNIIYTIGDGMKDLLSNYVSLDKIKVVPIWTDNSFLQPVSKEKNTFLKDNNLEDTFNIIYSGNLGVTHPLEVLLEVAEDLKEDPVKIIIIGEGKKKKKLQNLKKEKELDNVFFLSYQEMDVFPYSMAASDIGVVTLGSEASQLSVPSKTFNLMSVGAPILCISGYDSELESIINKFENGKCFRVNQRHEILNFINKVRDDQNYRTLLVENSLAASKHYTPLNAQELMFVEDVSNNSPLN